MTKKKMNNKGFTLVELIVVLVILAILAAILVPTLLGYIDRAKSEKDYSTAQSLRVATQSIIAELYAKDDDGIIKDTDVTGKSADILQLIGGKDGQLDGVDVSITSIKLSNDKTNQIMEMEVSIGGKAYVLKNNVWEAKDTSATTTTTPTT